MEAIREKVGFKGDLTAFFAFMRTDKQFYEPNTDAGRAAYLKKADDYVSGMKAKIPEYFGILPKADLIVKRVESFREEPGGVQHYFQGTPDGSRPGIYYVHLLDMSAMPLWDLESTTYHEALPGHHMQISIAQELTGIPFFRTQYGSTAYVEGWEPLYGAAVEGDGLLYGPVFRHGPSQQRDVARGAAGGGHRHPFQGMERRAGAEILHG